jgi:hypothetical protein
MATIRHLRSPQRNWLVGTLGLFLISGCETPPTPVEPAEAAEQLPPGITSKTTLVGEAAYHAWVGGLTGELEDVNHQIRSAGKPNQELLRRAGWLHRKIAEAGAVAPAKKRLRPRTTETPDEDFGITDFGTQLRMPWGGPLAVVAYTNTSRPTNISHSMTIVKTTEGSRYSTSMVDQTGSLLPHDYLITTVGIDGDCSKDTTLDAATEHRASSFTFRTRYAFSSAKHSCGPPAARCGDDGDGPGGELITGMSPTAGPSMSCTGGGGGGPGGDGGGESGMYRCYTVTTDHYWYDPEADTYEYRYTEESTWCELIE